MAAGDTNGRERLNAAIFHAARPVLGDPVTVSRASTSGVPKFYIDGKWILSKEGDAVGILDEQREWIFSPQGEPLGYLFPKLQAEA